MKGEPDLATLTDQRGGLLAFEPGARGAPTEDLQEPPLGADTEGEVKPRKNSSENHLKKTINQSLSAVGVGISRPFAPYPRGVSVIFLSPLHYFIKEKSPLCS